MVTVSDLYTGLFGHPARVAAAHRLIKPAHDAYNLVVRSWFYMPMQTSNGDTLQVRVDASQAFYSIFKLADFEYSKTHKNYTLSKGTRGQARTFIAMPLPGVIKRSTEFKDFVAENKMWAVARQTAIERFTHDGMLEELLAAFPNCQEILDLKDEDARAYFESNGWEVPTDINFANWRPCGWTMTQGPDGYGHQCGLAVKVDWAERKFGSYGWSSDD